MSALTPEGVRDMVARVAACAGDYEIAHSAEDVLHLVVLEAIAEGTATDPAACAHEALKSSEIEFMRCCA